MYCLHVMLGSWHTLKDSRCIFPKTPAYLSSDHAERMFLLEYPWKYIQSVRME